MTCKKWTYGGDPSKSSRDAVRFLVGDTMRERPLLDDREIDYILSDTTNTTLAAARACEALWSRFMGLADYTVGNVSKKYGSLADKFKARSEEFRARVSERALVSFPATLVSEKRTLQADPELAPPQFAVGLADSPLASQINTELTDLWRERGWW